MKLAVVTGASSGVGLAVASRFVAKGWSVVGFARTRAALEAAANTLGRQFSYEVVDVRDAAQVQAAFARIPWVHVLVNNAAVFRMKPFAECTTAELDAMIDTNLKGTLHCTHAALPRMAAGARIIHIGSVAGTHGIANQAIYCASKWGVEGFADALAQELQPRGILVTTIAPGGIDTPLWQAEGNPYPGPPGKILEADDVARAVEYVAEQPPHVVLKRMTLFPTNEWH